MCAIQDEPAVAVGDRLDWSTLDDSQGLGVGCAISLGVGYPIGTIGLGDGPMRGRIAAGGDAVDVIARSDPGVREDAASPEEAVVVVPVYAFSAAGSSPGSL